MIFKREPRMANPFRMKVHKKGFKANVLKDLYHHVLAASWFEFFAATTAVYLFLNCFWALIYFLSGNQIINADPNSFWDAFVFSFQTSATIGYGHLLPGSTFTDIVVILDTISGLTFVAITTGLAFAKFSRPTTRVLFTEKCTVHRYHGEKTLFFRVANARDSHIADASIFATVVMAEDSEEGVVMQRIHDLKLVRSKTPIFALSWMVMHVINDESPLQNLTREEMMSKNLRIVVSMTGVDDWTSQMVHTNQFYTWNDIVYNYRFEDILESNEDGSATMDYSKFNLLVEFEAKS